MMNHKSPSKVLRNVIRMTKFLENKKKPLKITTLPSVNIEPQEIYLSRSLTTSISIPPTKSPRKPQLSIAKVGSTDITPDLFPCMYCMLVPPFPNLPRTPTSPVPDCAVCTRPVDDRYEPQICCNLLMHQHCWGNHMCDGWS